MTIEHEFEMWLATLDGEQRYLATERVGISIGALPITREAFDLAKEEVRNQQAETQHNHVSHLKEMLEDSRLYNRKIEP